MMNNLGLPTDDLRHDLSVWHVLNIMLYNYLMNTIILTNMATAAEQIPYW